MINSDSTLEEFILDIPSCYKDSNLETWISAINKSPLRMVALIDREGTPQGIIQNNSLLELITNSLLSEKDIQQQLDATFLNEVIVSLNSLPSQIKVKDFLRDFTRQQGKLEQNYFIVDGLGKLLGILDLSKLLQTAWHAKCSVSRQIPTLSKQNHTITENKFSLIKEKKPQNCFKATRLQVKKILPTQDIKAAPNTIKNNIVDRQKEFEKANPILASCLAKISVPLMIENVKGEICYQNTLWHQTSNIKEKELTLPPNIYIYNQTKGIHRRKSNPEKKISATSNHCATINNLAVIDSISQQVKTQVRQLNSFVDKAAQVIVTKQIEEQYSTDTVSTQANTIRQERLDYWHYYQLPLVIKSDCLKFTDTPEYWLVFATEFPLQPPNSTTDLGQQRQFVLKQLQDEFLLNISHDIKSPLTTIIGLSSLLKEKKLGSLNSSQTRYSQMIYHSGKRLINLINDFLEITHLTTRKLQFNWELIELENTCQQLYDQVIEKLKALATIKQNNIPLFPELQLEINSDARTVMADKAYFCQILTRLLENALTLTSATELLGITAEHWSNWLAITVWNEGGGFSEAQQNILTPEFSQYGNFLTSQAKNQALGLILAQQLAQAHGGDISFISQSNYGSEFTLLLPLKPSQKASEINISNYDSNSETNQSLVLIIDTVSKRIIDLSEKLKSLGYNCAIARNHEEALYKTRCLQPWQIILDSSILQTSTKNLVQVLKSNPQTSKIPLFLITDTNSSSKCDNSLADRILTYPISRATLSQFFPPIVSRQSFLTQNLTVLRLSLKEEINHSRENLALDFVFEDPSFSLSHHIIEADSLEQAHLLAEIWNIDAIIWDGVTLNSPEIYLQSFAESAFLASIPIITLDARTTAAANKISNLAVFPCLLPANERSIQQLTQVIQIAAGFG